MKSIKLPDTNIADMRQFYQEELDKTLRRIQHIKSVLDQLGGSEQSIQIQITSTQPKATQPKAAKPETPKPKGRKPAVKTTGIKRAKKKTGRKSMWDILILKRLRELGRPVTYDQLTEEIMTFSKLPEERRKSTKQAIVNVIFRLRTRDKKLDTFSTGTREKYIALNQWFGQPGEVKKEYAKKIKNPQGTTKYKKRRARPAKAKA